MDNETPLRKAVRIAGSQVKLARLIGGSVRQQHVWKWLRSGVPAEHCPAIEAATGVRCEALRADVPWHVIRGTPEVRTNHPAKQAGVG